MSEKAGLLVAPQTDSGAQFSPISTQKNSFGQWSAIRDAVHLSAAFALLEGCVVASLALAPAYSADLGLRASGTLYFSFAFSNFLSPATVWLCGPKWILVLSMAAYCLYILAYISPTAGLLIPACVVAGLAAACIWTAQGTYITAIAIWYAARMGWEEQRAIGLFNGIFNVFFQFCLFAAQIASSLVLHHGSRNGLFWAYTITCVIATICMAFLPARANLFARAGKGTPIAPEPHSNSGHAFPVSAEEPAKQTAMPPVVGFRELLTLTVKLWCTDKRALAMTFSNIAFGLCSGFQNGDFVKFVVSPSLSKENIGYVFAINYGVSALVALPLGWISDHPRVGRVPGMVIGFLAYASATVWILAVNVSRRTKDAAKPDEVILSWAALSMISTLWGIGHYCISSRHGQPHGMQFGVP